METKQSGSHVEKRQILKKAKALKEAKEIERKKKTSKALVVIACVILVGGILWSARETRHDQSTVQKPRTLCEEFPTTVAHARKMIPLLKREGAQFRFTSTNDVYVNRRTAAWIAYWDYASIQEKEQRAFALAMYNHCVNRRTHRTGGWGINLRDHHTGTVFARRAVPDRLKLVE